MNYLIMKCIFQQRTIYSTCSYFQIHFISFLSRFHSSFLSHFKIILSLSFQDTKPWVLNMLISLICFIANFKKCIVSTWRWNYTFATHVQARCHIYVYLVCSFLHQYVVFTRVTQKLSRKPRSQDQPRPPNTSWYTSMEMSQRQLATCNCRCDISAGQLVKTGPCGAPSSSDARKKGITS